MLSQTQVVDACLRTGSLSLVDLEKSPETGKAVYTDSAMSKKSTSTESADSPVHNSDTNRDITEEEIAKRKRDAEIFKRQIDHFNARQEAARKQQFAKRAEEDNICFSIYGADPVDI